LTLREEFLGFKHLRPLQVTDFSGEALDRSRHNPQNRKVHGMPIARNDLRRDRLDGKAERLRNMRFDAWIDLREGAHCTGNGAGRHFAARANEALPGPKKLCISIGELQAKGGGLRMDAMGAADGRRKFMLESAPLKHLQEPIDIAEQEIGGAHELNVETGVEHVRGGHSMVHETRLGPDDFGKMGKESNNVVPDLALDLLDASNIKDRVLPFLPDFPGCGWRYQPELCHCVGRMRFDLKPDAIARLRVPDGGYFRPGVARDHRVAWLLERDEF
jgi:hypothetical protein